MTEPEVITGRRAFAEAQLALAGQRVSRISGLVPVGWHDTAVHPEAGSFAVVRTAGPLTDLIGEVVRVSANGREVYAYVITAAGVPTDLSLARRAFLGLGLLALESLDCTIEVVA